MTPFGQVEALEARVASLKSSLEAAEDKGDKATQEAAATKDHMDRLKKELADAKKTAARAESNEVAGIDEIHS